MDGPARKLTAVDLGIYISLVRDLNNFCCKIIFLEFADSNFKICYTL